MSIVAVYIAMADRVLYPGVRRRAAHLPALAAARTSCSAASSCGSRAACSSTIIMTVVFFKWNARGEDSTAGAQVDWKPSTA